VVPSLFQCLGNIRHAVRTAGNNSITACVRTRGLNYLRVTNEYTQQAELKVVARTTQSGDFAPQVGGDAIKWTVITPQWK
jgi:hypothetical protein